MTSLSFFRCACNRDVIEMTAVRCAAAAMIEPFARELGLFCEGGRVGSVVTRRAIDVKVRGSSPAHGGSRIAA